MSSLLVNKSTPSLSLVVVVLRASSLVGALLVCQERHVEVTERSLVSVHGIPLMSSTPLLVLVSRVTSTVLRPTSRSSWLVMVPSLTAARPSTIPPIRASTLWVDGLVTGLSVATLLWFLAHALVWSAVLSASDTLFAPPSTSRTSALSGSAWQVRWVTVSSKLQRRRDSSILRRVLSDVLILDLVGFICKIFKV